MPKKLEYQEIDENSYIFTNNLKISTSHVRINCPKPLNKVFGDDKVEIIVVKNKNKDALIKAIESVPSNK